VTKTWNDVGLTSENPNPIVLNGGGRNPNGAIFLASTTSYKYVLRTAGTDGTCSTGTVVWSQDNIAPVPIVHADVDITGTAGETLTAGQVVYLSDGSGAKTVGRWYKADSANLYSSTTPEVGIVPATIASAASGTIRLSGSVTGLSALTVGAKYYVGTAGAVTSTAPANQRFVGQADSATSLVLSANPPIAGLGVPQGGTGAATFTTHGVLLGEGTSAFGVTAVGAANQALVGVASADPTFQNVSRIIDTGAQAAFSNSVAENTLYTFSVPGGTLGTTRVLHFSMIGQTANNSGGGCTFTVRVKYGATTIYTGAFTSINTGNFTNPLALDVELMAAGATGSQVSRAVLNIDGIAEGDANTGNAITKDFVAGAAGSQLLAGGAVSYAVRNTISEDSTAAKTFTVTFQSSVANAAIAYSQLRSYLEVK
jgi:hypothetical protein